MDIEDASIKTPAHFWDAQDVTEKGCAGLIVCRLQINATKYLCTLQPVKKVIYAWQGVSTFHCLLIQ